MYYTTTELSNLSVSKKAGNNLNSAERYQMYDLDDYYDTANEVVTDAVSFSYSIEDPSGTDVTSAELKSSKYWTPTKIGSYRITVTATDNTVVVGTNARTARTASDTFTVSVTGANYYFSSAEIKNGDTQWATLNEYKLKDNGNGSYSLDVSLTTNYEFIIKSDGASGVTFQGTVDDGNNKFDMSSSVTTCNTVTPWNSTYNGKYGRHFKWTGTGGTYTITFTPGSTQLSIGSIHTSGFYLTGRLNNHNIPTRSGNLKFTETSENSHIYTLTTSFTATDNSTGYQYATISKHNGTVYYPSKADGDSGCAVNASTTTEPVTGTQKWKILAGTGKTVTFTLTCNGSDVPQSLSWTIVEATVYAKDGAAPSDTKIENTGNSTTAYYNYAAIAGTTITTKNGVSVGTLAKNNVGASSSQYEKLNVSVGDKLVITTTIASTYRTKYYVKAFNVNGKSYNIIDASQANTETGVYTLNYEVPSDLSTTAIEITPVYYMIPSALPNAPGGSTKVKLITYYLQDFDSSLGWGNSPYAYPFYGNYSSIANSFGAYPGQPFINEDDVYSIEIPLYNLPVDTAVKVDKDGAIKLSNAALGGVNEVKSAYNTELVKGVVVSNGYYDKVHADLNHWSSEADHMQTYDSDGFFKVYNEQLDKEGNEPSAIYQQLKYIPSSKTNNRATYGTAIPEDDDGNAANTDTDQHWGYSTHTPNNTLTQTNLTNINNGNGWELYTDYYGRPIDIFGNVIGNSYSAASEVEQAAIRVISTGYSSNVSGDYGTAWLIYLPNGSGSTEVSTGLYKPTVDEGNLYTLLKDDDTKRYGMPPSVLAIRNEDNFDDFYPVTDKRTVEYKENDVSVASVTYSDNVENYHAMWTTLQNSWKYRYVYISYESSQQKTHRAGTTNGAYRIDSKWAYSFDTDMVNTDIEIEYWDDSESAWVTDTVTPGSNTGTNSGCSAYFTNDSFNNQMTTGDQLINKYKLNFTAVSGTSGGTTYMFDSWWVKGANEPLTKKEASYSRQNGGNATLVARFMPVSAGNLVISNKASVNGIADTKVRARIKNGETVVYDTAFVADEVKLGVSFDSPYISNVYSDYDIEVTLSTKPLALNTFSSFSYDSFTSGLSKTAGSLDGATTSQYTFKVGALFSNNTQVTKSITETSTVAVCANVGSYNYVYKDRFGLEQTISSTIYLDNAAGQPDNGHPDTAGAVTVYNKTSSENFSNITEALASRAPSTSAVNVYQKTLNFDLTGVGSSFDTEKYGSLGEGYTGFATNAKYNGTSIVVYATETVTNYNFTYVVNGNSYTMNNCPYGESVIISEEDKAANVPSANFLGWSTKRNESSKIISPYRDFCMILAKDTTVYAIYGTPSDTTWRASIDMVNANRNGGTASLDILCRFTNQDKNAEIPDEDVDMGLIFVSGSSDLPSTTYTSDRCTEIANAVLRKGLASGSSGLVTSTPKVIATVYKFAKGNLNNYNRVHQILNATYSKVTSTNFAVYSYIKVGDHLEISDPILFGTFTGGLFS